MNKNNSCYFSIKGLLAASILSASISPGTVLSGSGEYSFTPDSAIGQSLLSLGENQWGKLNTNTFQSVFTPSDQFPLDPIQQSYGPSGVVWAWGGMAWDNNRGDLILFGGGHANYAGNEVYRFRTSTMSWERSSLPSEVQKGVTDPTLLASGRGLDKVWHSVGGIYDAPASVHNYDNSGFLVNSDRFVSFGGATFNTGRSFEDSNGEITGPYFWDPSKADGNKVGGATGTHVNRNNQYPDIVGGNMWQNRDNLGEGSSDDRPGRSHRGFLDGTSDYIQENGNDVAYLQSHNTLFKYAVLNVDDPSTDVYEKVGRAFNNYSYGRGAGAYSPDHNLFLRSTRTSVLTYWDLSDGGSATNDNIDLDNSAIIGGQDFDFTDLQHYGIEYDPIRERFMLWGGDNDVWALTPPDDTIESWALEMLGIGGDIPPNLRDSLGRQFTGVLGKWEYSEELDVFLGVIDPFAGDVWAYKPENWSPAGLTAPVPLPGAFYLLISGLASILTVTRRGTKIKS